MQEKITFFDFSDSYFELKNEIDEAIQRVLSSGRYILGEEVENFERAWAEYTESNYCVTTSNGLTSIELVLKALNIGPGDEVIVPSNTYVATWLAVTNVGATVVPVEPNADTYNIDAALIEKAITGKTKCIILVHLYGMPSEIDKVQLMIKDTGIHLIEDAAQCHGAKYNNIKIGAHTTAACWSFYPGKNLGAIGDAGGITTNLQWLAENLKLQRNYGSKIKYENDLLGTNARMDPIQAAVLSVKLKYLDEWNERRRQIANKYIAELNNDKIIHPQPITRSNSVWHQYVIRTADRDSLVKHMENNEIDTMVHYPIPPYLQKAYAWLNYTAHDFPIATSISKEILSIPIHPHLEDFKIKKIIDTLNAY